MSAPAAIELNVMNRNPPQLEAPPRPQTPQTWCGRAVHAIPGCLGVSAVAFGTGMAIYGGVIHNYVFTGGGILVDVTVVALSVLYYCNVPTKNIEDSTRDLQKQNSALTNEVAVLKQTLEENKKVINSLQASVATAATKVNELETVLKNNAAEMKDVTQKLTETKNAFVQMQAISNIFRSGVSDLANKVLKLTQSENEELKRSVQEIVVIVQKLNDLNQKVDSEVVMIKAANDEFSGDLQNYGRLMGQLKNVVDVLIPDFEAHQQTDKELEGMKEQAKLMRQEIDELKQVKQEHEKLQETVLEYQRLVQNLNDPAVMSKLSKLLQRKNDPKEMAQYLEEKFSKSADVDMLTTLLKAPDSPEKLSRLVALITG